jgi:CBS domain-containing protein
MTMLACTGADLSLDTFVVSPGSSLREALALQHRIRHGLLVVVDGEGVVAGTVSDDAIRRAVLDGRALDVPVVEVMTSDPVVVPAGASDAEIVGVLQAHRVRSVPLVDADGRL